MIRSHVPSNRQTRATLSHCRGWADCITITLARLPEAAVSPSEKGSAPMGGEHLIFSAAFLGEGW
jgi:hypothetical protein